MKMLWEKVSKFGMMVTTSEEPWGFPREGDEFITSDTTGWVQNGRPLADKQSESVAASTVYVGHTHGIREYDQFRSHVPETTRRGAVVHEMA
jgi:hypothetical protein